MPPSVERADLAAQDSGNHKISCPRCFAVVPGETEVCPECGYALSNTAADTDTGVYQDLAQANLARMRGDKQAAIDQCLKVLRAFPNNVTAHSLLGEIYMEHGELKQAAEWFEMTLDLNPAAARERQLLERVQQLMEETDHKATIQQLEVKPKSGLTALWVGMVAVILAVAAASYFIGQNSGRSKAVATGQKPAAPLRLPAQSKPDNPNAEPAVPDLSKILNERLGSAPADDRTALEEVVANSQKRNLILTLLLNPSNQEILISAEPEDGVPFETTALLISADVFVGRAATKIVTTRLIKSGRVVFVGTLARDSYDELQGLSGNTPVDQLAVQAFPSGWHADRQTQPGSPVEPQSRHEPEPTESSSPAAPTGT